MNLLAKLALGMHVMAMRRRDRWPRDRLVAFQQARLARLVRFARARSPHYGRVLAGLDRAPLAELPILTKSEFVFRWNDLVTDRSLTRENLARFLDKKPAPDQLYGGRYQVMSTSGTTGMPAIFCYGPGEWAHVLASTARLTAWRGVGPTRRDRLAVVVVPGWGLPPPMGARITASMRRLLPSTVFIDAALPTAELVAALNQAQPTQLAAYPGTLSVLAEEQHAGRLQIAPNLIQSSSAVFEASARARVTEVFGVVPHEAYAMTEGGFVAGTCALRRGMHIQEDEIIVEVQDEAGRAAPPGEVGSRTLLTVLWSRTLPIIRYQISDRVRLSAETCGCGRPYTLIAEIDGRAEEVLVLRGADGSPVRLRPSQVRRILSPLPISDWQVRHVPQGIELSVVVRDDDSFDKEGCRETVRRALADEGVADASVEVRVVERIATLPSGKTPRFMFDTESPSSR